VTVAKESNDYNNMFTENDLESRYPSDRESTSHLDILGYIGLVILGLIVVIIITLAGYKIWLKRRRE